ncbi:unnamed protein product [Symbiodinium sp. KB8]|nr:unnamed protein product [Symbiodinium sp. KB8]
MHLFGQGSHSSAHRRSTQPPGHCLGCIAARLFRCLPALGCTEIATGGEFRGPRRQRSSFPEPMRLQLPRRPGRWPFCARGALLRGARAQSCAAAGEADGRSRASDSPGPIQAHFRGCAEIQRGLWPSPSGSATEPSACCHWRCSLLGVSATTGEAWGAAAGQLGNRTLARPLPHRVACGWCAGKWRSHCMSG